MKRKSAFLWISIVLLGFALRVYHLDSPPLRWDEGWSLGLASLPWGEINRITALDVHPPLYYYLLKPWLVLGKGEFWVRYFSVLMGTLAIPLAGAMGRAWRGRETGMLAAFYTAIAPILVYYAQVTRMFALAVALIALAGYGLLRALSDGKRGYWLCFVLASAAALYTFYYAAFIVAAFLAYALISIPRRTGALRRPCMAFGMLAALYLPWLLYALGPMWHRVGRRTAPTPWPSSRRASSPWPSPMEWDGGPSTCSWAWSEGDCSWLGGEGPWAGNSPSPSWPCS